MGQNTFLCYKENQMIIDIPAQGNVRTVVKPTAVFTLLVANLAETRTAIGM
jgi:hypothetical protein